MLARRSIAALVLAALALAAPRAADAICTAASIVGSAQEPGCAAGLTDCLITGNYVVENGCTLDFGDRAVILSGRLTFGTRTMTLRARRLSLAASGFLDGVGDAPNARGGFLQIETTGTVSTGSFDLAQGARIDVTGRLSGGDVKIRAGGNVSISGRIQADFDTATASGGTIQISAGGNLVAATTSTLSARGGLDSDGGGQIDLSAAGSVSLGSDLLVNGIDGGFAQVRAGTTVSMAGVDASGGGDAGSGGCVDIFGTQGVQVSGHINADGDQGTFMTGGCGGLICVDGDGGDAVVAASALISADGGSPDGGGGQISILSLRTSVVNGILRARGPAGGETCGGDICVDAGLDVTINATARLDASGGDAGGEVAAFAGRNIVINGELRADGRRGGSLGGDASARAGTAGYGSLTLNALVDVTSAAACSVENGCGTGGLTDFFGCNVTLGPAGEILAGAPEAGENNLSARELLTVQGHLDAQGTRVPVFNGANRLLYPARRPVVLNGVIAPAPLQFALTTCPNEGPTMPRCLMPCPTCGNGAIEFPETCDPGLMPPMSCQANGCSLFCRAEDCDDQRLCTGDSCFAEFGCRHVVTPICTEPPTATPTVTPTRPTATASQTRTVTTTASITVTPSATRSATASGTMTGTATPTLTATLSPTASATGTSTATSVATATAVATASATPTPPATATASLTATQTSTATATATTSASATETASPTACVGDCNGDGEVTVNELITGVNIALGNAPASSCPAFDRTGDGEVSIAELIAAVNAALDGC